jgi:hypothetical protein
MSAAYLQNPSAAERSLARNMMVKLNTSTIRFVRGAEFQLTGGIILERVIEKQDVIASKSTSEVRVPKFPYRTSQGANRKQFVNHRQ